MLQHYMQWTNELHQDLYDSVKYQHTSIGNLEVQVGQIVRQIARQIASMLSEDVHEGFIQQEEEIQIQEQETYPESFEIHIEIEEKVLPLPILVVEEEPKYHKAP